jgi:hypothetical protein
MTTVVSLNQLRGLLKSSHRCRRPGPPRPSRTQALLDALAEAHAEVLGKLGVVYSIPDVDTWDDAPELVGSMILAVAAYLATLTWLNGRDLSDRDPVALRYNRAQLMLRQGGGVHVGGGRVGPGTVGWCRGRPNVRGEPTGGDLAGGVNGPRVLRGVTVVRWRLHRWRLAVGRPGDGLRRRVAHPRGSDERTPRGHVVR